MAGLRARGSSRSAAVTGWPLHSPHGAGSPASSPPWSPSPTTCLLRPHPPGDARAAPGRPAHGAGRARRGQRPLPGARPAAAAPAERHRRPGRAPRRQPHPHRAGRAAHQESRPLVQLGQPGGLLPTGVPGQGARLAQPVLHQPWPAPGEAVVVPGEGRQRHAQVSGREGRASPAGSQKEKKKSSATVTTASEGQSVSRRQAASAREPARGRRRGHWRAHLDVHFSRPRSR